MTILRRPSLNLAHTDYGSSENLHGVLDYEDDVSCVCSSSEEVLEDHGAQRKHEYRLLRFMKGYTVVLYKNREQAQPPVVG